MDSDHKLKRSQALVLSPGEDLLLSELLTTGAYDSFFLPQAKALLAKLKQHDIQQLLEVKANAKDCGIFGKDFDDLVAQSLHGQSVAPENTASVWDKAVPATQFVQQRDEEHHSLVSDLVYPGAITILAAPRGTGKSMVALAIAVAEATGGVFRDESLAKRRILLVDRDNPPHIVRERLRNWGVANADNLMVLTRNDAPSLLEPKVWASFPANDYDVIIIDSLGAATEGVSEKEGKQTQQFLATLKDLAHRSPAILILDNTNKAATSYRGRGEKADAIDVLYEVRDITGWIPPQGDAWWEQLPEAGDHAWQTRASRRKGQTIIRLAFIPSKFRLGVEPEPFALEIDMSRTPWTLVDITDRIAKLGEEAAIQERQEKRRLFEQAATTLVTELRNYSQDDPMLKSDAETFLQGQGLIRKEARNLLQHGYNGEKWTLQAIPNRKGSPIGVYPMGGYSGEEGNGKNNVSPKSPQYSLPSGNPISADKQPCGGKNDTPLITSNDTDFQTVDSRRVDITARQKSDALNPSNGADFRDGDLFSPTESPQLGFEDDDSFGFEVRDDASLGDDCSDYSPITSDAAEPDSLSATCVALAEPEPDARISRDPCLHIDRFLNEKRSWSECPDCGAIL